MTAIKATCPIDGEVELTHADINLMICKDDDKESYYSFVCPTCHDVIKKPADAHVQKLLVQGGGVKPVTWKRQKYPEVKPPPGPAFTEDDLIAFGLFVEKNL